MCSNLDRDISSGKRPGKLEYFRPCGKLTLLLYYFFSGFPASGTSGRSSEETVLRKERFKNKIRRFDGLHQWERDRGGGQDPSGLRKDSGGLDSEGNSH